MSTNKSKSKPFTAGRLAKPTSQLLQDYVDGPALKGELRLLPHVVQVDRAHLIMLAAQGLVTDEQAGSIIEALEDLDKDGEEQFSAKPGYGTINLQIEEYLSQRLGHNIAGRLPIGRSRIDHGATVRRVSDRANLLNVQNALLSMQEALLRASEQHANTPIISFTHMQQAQPATFGHYLLAFHTRLVDCFQQLSQLYDRVNRCPLGAVGLSGTELPIDRAITTSLLGFPAIQDNSLTGRDAYYQIEFAFSLGMIMTILNDLCTDLHIHSATEFGYVDLDDSHCSTSSIFPQKKNPVALEAVKLAAAESHGWVAAALAIFRNEGTADQYYRSLPFLPTACNSTANMLRLTAEIVDGLIVKRERCEQQLAKAWVTTSRLGNALLLRHELDFRTAHSLVGRMVKICLARGMTPREVTVEVFQEAAGEMGVSGVKISQEELITALDYRRFLQECNSAGGVGAQEFLRLLERAKEQNDENMSWADEKERLLATARFGMDKEARRLRENAIKTDMQSRL
ncbi:L-Aspartase-like protein [Aspergillus keveii]|uniref:Arginosuccinase n=1 Tax=Aspergillus keveii TaxID=714993 RepID=A0ABR4G2Z2_9EURO